MNTGQKYGKRNRGRAGEIMRSGIRRSHGEISLPELIENTREHDVRRAMEAFAISQSKC